MKINRIKALCKKAHRCIILNDSDGRQYIGTTSAIYPADGLTLTQTSIGTLFDMPDAGNVLRVEEKALEDSDIAPKNEYKWANLREGGNINWLGDALYALVDDDSGYIFWVNAEYIRAAEYTEGYRMYRLTENAKGEPIIMIEDGLLVIGIVKPIAQRTAQSIGAHMAQLSHLHPMGSPNPGEVKKQDNGELEGQMNMDDMMEEDDHDTE